MASMSSDTTSYQPLVDNAASSYPGHTGDGIPRIDLNLWNHKLSIGIHWTILFISSGVLPIVLYFVLRYVAHLSLGIVLAVTTAIFGVVTLFSMGRRLFLLLRAKSTCRPLGASRGALDYFMWNFLGGFVSTTVIIVIGNITKDIRIVTLGLPILIIDVSIQMLLAGILHIVKCPAPFRMSSVERGDKVRSGVYAIAEDIAAVDGGQGQRYRRQLQDRYLHSSIIRTLCFRLDILWGVTGLAVGSACLVLIFVHENANVAYILGWVIPWAYAAIMAFITIRMVSSAAKKENRAAAMNTKLEGYRRSEDVGA